MNTLIKRLEALRATFASPAYVQGMQPMPSDLLHPFAKPLPAYRDMTFDTLERHWSDPAYRARCEAERAHQQ